MASTPSNVVAAAPVIDGKTPSKVVVPSSAQEIADILATAAAESIAIAPTGGGTSLALGNVQERFDVAL